MNDIISRMFGVTTKVKLYDGNIIFLPGIPPTEVNSLIVDIKEGKIELSSMLQMNISSSGEEEVFIKIEDIEIVLP